MQDLRILKVSKSFGDSIAFRDLSLTVPNGARVALMGASGVGKTTLLRCLLGLERVDSGHVLGMPARVGVVFQEDRLCPWLTVLENIRIACPRTPATAVNGMLASLGLAGEENKKAAELSGGMARRVAIARALLFDGDMLILDEPFAGLDEENLHRTAAAIRTAAQGKTLLLVTHDEAEAALLHATVVRDLFA